VAIIHRNGDAVNRLLYFGDAFLEASLEMVYVARAGYGQKWRWISDR
jgi:hypothetical protein